MKAGEGGRMREWHSEDDVRVACDGGNAEQAAAGAAMVFAVRVGMLVRRYAIGIRVFVRGRSAMRMRGAVRMGM